MKGTRVAREMEVYAQWVPPLEHVESPALTESIGLRAEERVHSE